MPGVGDINNDSFDDILVAASGFENSGGEGKVYLFLGSATGPGTEDDWARRGLWQDVVHGHSMAAVGDVNGDGYDDFAVGASGTFSDLTGNGRVTLYLGSSNGVPQHDNEWTTFTTNTLLGYSIAGLGDLNDDGYDDFAFGEPLYDTSAKGRVQVVLGASNGVADTPAMEIVGDQSGQLFGAAITAFGDLNDDGINEVAISSVGLGNSPGFVEYYFGDTSAYLRKGASPLLAEGGVNGQHLGILLTSGGDFDSDGLAEILITSLDSDVNGNSGAFVYSLEKRNSRTELLAYNGTDIDLQLDEQ